MGFLDGLNTVLGAVTAGERKRQEFYDRYYSQYSRWDKERLEAEYRRFRNGASSGSDPQSMARRQALKAVYRERGYIE